MNEVFIEQQLLSEVIHNLICTDIHFILQPYWLCPPQLSTGPFSSFSFTFLDPDGSITWSMTCSHLAMFGKAITSKRWQVRPPILQCSHCYGLGHQGLCCLPPKDALCCHWCSENHPLKCKKVNDHMTPGKCNFPMWCITCKTPDHLVRDLVCPA
jgi:hypothetical protein